MTKIGLLVFPAALLVMAWWSGPASPVYGDILQTTGESVSIPLQAGWNLISLPLSPASTAPSDVFSSISGHYDLVYAYDAFDADDPWKVYDVSALPSFNTLNAISESMGLWVRALDPVTLTVTGTFSVQPGIRLAAGWNLVGYPSLFTRPLDEELTSIAGAYDLVYLYNAFDAQWPWKVYDANGQPSFNTLSHMQPGWGYWIRTSQAMTWTVNSALPAPINICGTITGNTTWGEAAPLYTVTCNTTVNSGVTLTMTAGTVIKMSSGVRLTVNGTLLVQGTPTQKVYITSLRDDAVGGDTNGDGSTSVPAANDWSRIVMGTNGRSVFDWAIIRYGGGNQGVLYNASGGMTVRNSTITNNGAQGIYNNSGTLTVTNSTISNNRPPLYSVGGGGILNNLNGRLVLENSTISGNVVSTTSLFGVYGGGGILNRGTAVITRSVIAGNTAIQYTSGGGGGVYNGGSMSIAYSTISNNLADQTLGGGLLNAPTATLTMAYSTISGNSAVGDGGGIENIGAMTITNSTISNNVATNGFTGGGGIDNTDGELTVINSTISNNHSSLNGGGVNIWGGAANLIFTTISGNNATGVGGGIWITGSITDTTVFLTNTIVGNSTSQDCVDEIGGAITTTNTLIQDNTCFPSLSGNPLLGPLQNNGGATATQALLAGSPAIDQIAPGEAGCGDTYAADQRDVIRPQGTRCDMGAYELEQ